MKMPYGYLPVRTVDSDPCPGDAQKVYVTDPDRTKARKVQTVADAPIWHHGANPNQAELYSGELRCTLTTVSPMIVGNQRVTWGSTCLADRLKNWCTEATIGTPVIPLAELWSNKKTILYPLTLPGTNGQPGPVLIAGESLKGMVRNLMSSLLNAPLERVQEQTYSYRPNTTIESNGVAKTKAIAAEVVRFNGDTLAMEIKPIELAYTQAEIQAYPTLRDVQKLLFCHGDDGVIGSAIGVGIQAGDPSAILCKGVTVANLSIMKEKQTGERWKVIRHGVYPSNTHGFRGVPLQFNENYRWLRYQFGIDKSLELATAFNSRGNAPVKHPSVLVSIYDIVPKALLVQPGVVKNYLDTQTHIVDTNAGHTSSRHPHARTVQKVGEIKAGDLIFCEIEWDGAHYGEVISFGHNFRYRWMHRDSICQITIAFDPDTQQWVPQRRPEVTALAEERPDSSRKAEKLAPHRRLFGFVAGSDEALGGLNQLPDPFNHLAGRVSFNFALERDWENRAPEQRFTAGSPGLPAHLVLLHPLGSPRGSLWETCVPKPPEGNRKTWGEGLLLWEGDDGNKRWTLQGGTNQFAGRRNYYHQLTDQLSLPVAHYCLLSALSGLDSTKFSSRNDYRDGLNKLVTSEQTGFARYITQPNVAFGFTVRFKDLAKHELAALVACLDPNRFAVELKKPEFACIANQDPDLNLLLTDTNGFGQKLGHGRSLGLGSVKITVDTGLLYATVTAFDTVFESGLGQLFSERRVFASDLKTWFDMLRLVRTTDPRKSYLVTQLESHKTLLKWVQEVRSRRMESLRACPGFP